MRISFERTGDVVIRCERISKRYRLGERQRYRALRDTIANLVQEPLGRIRSACRRNSTVQPNAREYLWALDDVSFDIRRGEVLGIVGRNGAGKSTLLKLLSRITKPTNGRAEIRGRVGALLEVGTGFHPELTGRENIYLNGAILGMKRREIERKFDEIVDFSGCAAFLDTPAKHYSSGMYMRLAFSVAAHLETEILLVDEVLAVGDAEFQQKCLGKMDVVAHAGRTVLFVSHNMVAVNSLCTRAICLDRGRVAFDGTPVEVTSGYLRQCNPAPQELSYQSQASAPGNEVFRLRKATARPLGNSHSGLITVRTPVCVEIEYWKLLSGVRLEIWADLYNELGIHLFETGWFGQAPSAAGLFKASFTIPGDLLNQGRHRMQLTVLGAGTADPLHLEPSLVFDVQDSADLRGLDHGAWPGVVRPYLQWTTEPIQDMKTATEAPSR